MAEIQLPRGPAGPRRQRELQSGPHQRADALPIKSSWWSTCAFVCDLKRHDMGPDLAEFDGNTMFTTCRLWGVADTAPYLHDGRALTLMEAIEIHGGTGSEAKPAVDLFLGGSEYDKHALIVFLQTLHTPRNPVADLKDFVAQQNEHCEN